MRSLALFSLLSLLLCSAPAMGSDFAFATGDGSTIPGVGPLDLPPDSVGEPVFIFLDIAGTTPSGTPCVTGASGGEICGFDLTIEVAGGHQIVSFSPAANVKYSPQTFNATTTTIHVVGLDAISPGTDAKLVGQLVLDTLANEGSVIVKGTAVLANLVPAAIEDEVVAEVPEPNPILVLIAGILTLRFLHTQRSRRDSFASVHTGH